MSKARTYDEFYPGYSPGPAMQVLVPATVHGINVANTVPASGNVQSNVIATDGWPKAAIGVTSTQAGQIQVQRYLDDAGLIPQGPALTATLVAATAQVLNVTDGNPFASMKITITNTGASAATLSNLGVLLSA